MLPTKSVPITSLSIQSFHDDSPPFTGAAQHNLQSPPRLSLGLPPSPPIICAKQLPPDNVVASSASSSSASFSTVSMTGPQSPSASSSDLPKPSQPRSREASGTSRPTSLSRQQSLSALSISNANAGSGGHQQQLENEEVEDGEADAESGSGEGLLDLQPNVLNSAEFLKGNAEYGFPKHRLKGMWEDTSKTPLVIVACGSFSPPTYLHLRMFEMAKDSILEGDKYEILGGYYSPVSDHYKKSGLAPADHRVKMCELAVETTSTWLMVDPWEAGQGAYQRTAVVLQHFEEELNGGDCGVWSRDGKFSKIKIMLLAGGDLIESFGEPGVWSEPDLHVILGNFGCLIVERAGSDVWAFLLSHDILYHHRRNIIVVKQLIYNDISSTKVRLFVRRSMSIKYLLPNSVIQYIYDQGLYRSLTPAPPPPTRPSSTSPTSLPNVARASPAPRVLSVVQIGTQPRSPPPPPPPPTEGQERGPRKPAPSRIDE